MKKLLWVAFPLVFIVIAIFSPDQPRARADHSSTTIMSEQAVVGPGTASVSSQVTPTEGGSDRHSFQYHATATAADFATWTATGGAAACDTSTSNVCIFNMTATTSLTANY